MSASLFHTIFQASVALCVAGLLWRVSFWFRNRIGADARTVTPLQRLAAPFRGIATACSSRQVFHLVGAFVFDILLQRRLYAQDKLRWLGHLLVFAGFMLLLLMHALAPVVTVKLFAGYESTRNPYLFLRNLFGAMVLIGMALLLFGVWRQRHSLAPLRQPKAVTSVTSVTFVVLLGLVMVTGFLLEAHKIASPNSFYRMTKQYNGSADPEQLRPLRTLWASEFGVAFTDLPAPLAPDLMQRGREMHAEDCETCHAHPASAFVSYPVARVLAPLAGHLDALRADTWLLYLHVLACFLGLATLPFTRLYHAVATPVSLLVNGSAPNRQFSAAGRASRRVLALDACVGCGICDMHCSVAPLARYLDNPYLLPSHKLLATSAMAGIWTRSPDEEADNKRFSEGSFLCTDCGRCTAACPVGLDLEDLWRAARGELDIAGLPAPAQWVQSRSALTWAESLAAYSQQHIEPEPDGARAPLSTNRASFSRCVQCQTCTNVCPVVAHSVAPAYGVDLTPQKVMNLLRLGLRDLTLGSRMVWSCATCYQCQEHCPEGIRVADIMVELRALAVQRLGSVRKLVTPP